MLSKVFSNPDNILDDMSVISHYVGESKFLINADIFKYLKTIEFCAMNYTSFL